MIRHGNFIQLSFVVTPFGALFAMGAGMPDPIAKIRFRIAGGGLVFDRGVRTGRCCNPPPTTRSRPGRNFDRPLRIARRFVSQP